MAATHVARVLSPVRAASRLPLAGLWMTSRQSTVALAATTTTTTPTPTACRLFHAHTRAAFPAPTRPVAAAADGTTAAVGGAAVGEAAGQAAEPPLPPLPGVPEPAAGPAIDWSASFHGLSTVPFAPEVAAKLMTPLDPEDVEVKPDGILYLPEIKYRRILNGAFGPGGWGLAPRGDLAVGDKVVSREYALVVQGRFVGQARGECPFFGDDGVATAGEGCKSNALMRCCKDIGIASELWDPRFIRQFKQKHCREVWVEHVATKKRRQIWLRKDCPPAYPYVLPSASPARTPTR